VSTPLGTLAGRVLAPSGAPVSGATVAMVGSTQSHRDIAVLTGPDGSFRFGGLAPGRYRVEARAHGQVGAADVEVSAGTPATVEIRLHE